MGDNDYDHFNDVINDTQGMFSRGLGSIDDGLHRFDTIVSQLQPNGLVVEMACRGCGKPKQLIVGWPEMVAIKCMVSPSDVFATVPQLAEWASPWRVARGQDGIFWVPEDCKCANCGQLVQPMFSPEECARHIQNMRRKGWLAQGDEVQVGQLCIARANALRR